MVTTRTRSTDVGNLENTISHSGPNPRVKASQRPKEIALLIRKESPGHVTYNFLSYNYSAWNLTTSGCRTRCSERYSNFVSIKMVMCQSWSF